MDLEDLMSLLGRNLAEIRRSRSLTQKDAAAKVGITYRYLQSIESGHTNVTLGTLVKIANFFNVHVCELLCGQKALLK